MGCARQFVLLLWKNYLLQKRQIKVTLLQLIIPAFFAVLLIALRILPGGTNVLTPTTWNSFSIPNVTSLDQGCILYYSPNTSSLTRTIMEGVVKRIESIDVTIGFDSESSLVRDFLEKLEEKEEFFNRSEEESFTNDNFCDVFAAVVFLELPGTEYNDSEHADDSSITYKLRFPSTLRTFVPSSVMRSSRWNTELVFPVTETIGPRNTEDFGGPPDYVSESFLTLQYSVDMAIIEAMKNDNVRPDVAFDLEMERFPYPPYKTETFIFILQRLFPMLMMFGFSLCAMLIVRDVVYEKEQRLKESMQMMGLDRRLHWLAWFCRYLFLLAASVAIETWLLVADIGTIGPVLRCISPLLLFAFLLSYVVATIAFCLAVSALFSSANLATAMGGLLFFISYFPYAFLQPHYDSLSWPTKVVACLLSNVAMAFGAQVIGECESSGGRLEWTSVNMTFSENGFPLLYVLLLLWFDALLYCIFAWYTDAVFPGEYGVPKPWNFPFQDLCQQLRTNSTAISDLELKPLKGDGLSDEDSEPCEFVPLVTALSSTEDVDDDHFERDPVGVNAGIMMNNLSKEFCVGSSRRTAVAGLTLNVYEGQITVLLGHNGAGKTTTFSILTGLYPPSSGKAFVNGFDIAKDMDRVRHSLGICPQASVLFDSLTVEEHLVFFSKLKASSVFRTKDEVAQMISDVGLISKRSALVSTLSGGMKRKLSVGIAFIGGSKVVILDEPTSGMDPYAQRQTWNLIRRCLLGRTILLSTHSMDEAEVLGDRIAIMVNGVIKCCGSPMFLKNRYGSGYRLTIGKSPDCNVAQLTDFIESYIPQAEPKCSLGADVSYSLPHNSRGRFFELFDGIDREKERLRIATYGISNTTLEEVFQRVGSRLWSYETGDNTLLVGEESTGVDESLHTSDQLMVKHLKSFASRCHVSSRRFQECFRHFCAMLEKRIHHTIRNRPLTFAQFSVPLLFLILPQLFRLGFYPVQDSPPLAMNLSIFSRPVVVFGFGVASNPNSDLASFASNYSLGFSVDVALVNVNNSRMGAKLCGTMRKYLVGEGNRSFANYVKRFEIAICLSRLRSEGMSLIHAIAFFNDEAYHTSSISLNAFDSAVLRYTMGHSAWRIHTINHPLPRTSGEIVKDQAKQGLEGSSVVFSTVVGFAFLTSSFALFLIRERAIGAKRGQLTSGASVWSFWSSTFLGDWIVFAILCVCVVASFAAFHIEPFVSDGNWMYVALLFALYGWAVLPFVYLASFIFTVPSSGFIWLTVVNSVLVSLASIVELLFSMGLDLMHIVRTAELISQLVPNFGLMKGLQTLYNNYNLIVLCQRDDVAFSCSRQTSHPCCQATCKKHCFVYSANPLGMDSRSEIGEVLLFLAFDGLLYFGVLLLIDSGRLQIHYYHIQMAWNFVKRKFTNEKTVDENDSSEDDDDDVASERRRINDTPHERLLITEVVLLKELTKSFGRFVAVDRLSVGISEGECFGLLGVNGAGKTTVFEMLLGDKFISKGLAFLRGRDIRKRIAKIGYCPQSDALIAELTGRELLCMYAWLRGVNRKAIPSSVQQLIDALLLRSDADRLVKTYSGGTKRKLSTAVALVGWPRIILLDEPSSGLDPVARRHVWDTLLKLRDSKRTIVLSTHSMVECETLCTRLAIMVNGRFQCLGSTQHLKSRFGAGFTLSVMLQAGTEANISDDETAEQVRTYLSASLPGSSFKDVEHSIMVCCVPVESVRLSEIFRAMEALRSRLSAIEDYAVTQATLEEIFVSFARDQFPPRPAIGWGKRWKRTVCRFLCACFRHCWSTFGKKCVTRSSSR